MNIDNLYDQVKATAEKAADKLNKTTDYAALQLKLSVVEKRLAEAYAELGRAVYLQMRCGKDCAEDVLVLLEKISITKKEIAELEARIREIKAK